MAKPRRAAAERRSPARAPEAPRFGAIERMRRAPWRALLGLIFLLAAAWRLFYLARLSASPLGGSLTEDSAIYWRWAGTLDQHQLQGKNPFFLGPLYPYALALLRPPVGGVTGVLIVQALWGAAAATLLADAARRLTGRGWGLAVGLWVALYPMAVFFDGLILMESLLFTLEALLLWWVARTDWAAARPVAWLVVGLLIGVLSEGRATAVLLLAPAAWCLCFGVAGTLPRRLTAVAALALGWILPIVPSAVHNWRAAHEWIPISYNGGINLYIGNGPQATGLFAPFGGTHIIGVAVGTGEDGGVEADARDYLRKVEGLDLTPAASSRHWSRKAREYVQQHPGRTAALAARKVLWMWNRREYPQIENALEYGAVAGPLGIPLLGFAVLGPLALAGLLVAWRRGPALGFVSGYVSVVTLSAAPFFVTDRYRHHLLPGMFLLAAVAGSALLRAWRDRTADLWRTGAALAAGVLLVQLPAPELHREKYDWGVAFDMGTRWAEQGRADLAVPEFEKALSLEASGQVKPTAAERGDLYYDYANNLQRVGRGAEANTWYERAVQVAPNHALALRALADVRLTQGRLREADSLYGALDGKAGGHLLALAGRARLAAGQGKLEEAEAMFREVVAADPSRFEAWGGLIRSQIQRGDVAAASASLSEARRSGLPAPASAAYQALLAALAGDRAGAERALEAVPPSAIQADPTLAEVVRITRGLLGGR